MVLYNYTYLLHADEVQSVLASMTYTIESRHLGHLAKSKQRSSSSQLCLQQVKHKHTTNVSLTYISIKKILKSYTNFF